MQEGQLYSRNIIHCVIRGTAIRGPVPLADGVGMGEECQRTPPRGDYTLLWLQFRG